MIKTGSNEGSSSGIADVKYQKAIKQISKLISLNTSLKKQIVTLQQTNQKLRSDFDSLQEKYNSLQLQLQQNKASSMTAQGTSAQNKSIDGNNSLRDHEASGQITNFIENKRKIQNLQEKISQKQEKITKLKHELEQKISQNKQLYRRNIDLSEQITKLKTNQNIKGFEAIQNERRKLKKELEQSEEWVKKISNDYQLLKKQLLFNEKSSINAKSIELGMGMSASIGQLRDPLSDFYFQKLRKLQAQNIRLKKQYGQKKQKFKSQINKLKQQNEVQLGKLMHLTSFVEKQQSFIQKFVISQKNQN